MPYGDSICTFIVHLLGNLLLGVNWSGNFYPFVKLLVVFLCTDGHSDCTRLPPSSPMYLSILVCGHVMHFNNYFYLHWPYWSILQKLMDRLFHENGKIPMGSCWVLSGIWPKCFLKCLLLLNNSPKIEFFEDISW